MDIFGVPIQAFLGQLLLGLVNGSFYAMLSLGLAVIFGLLNIINFSHGALYMMGAYVAYLALDLLGLGFWWSLALAPLIVGGFGMIIERLLMRWIYKLDHLYGLLLTFGLALIIEGVYRYFFGVSGQPYPVPDALRGATDLGFMMLPNYRAFVVLASLVVCLGTWYVIERTRLGAYLRAGTENPLLVQAFGVNVPLMVTLTFGFGVALAAIGGVLAAPVRMEPSIDPMPPITTTANTTMMILEPISGLIWITGAASTPPIAARATPKPKVSVTISGTLTPKACTSIGFSVPARR